MEGGGGEGEGGHGHLVADLDDSGGPAVKLQSPVGQSAVDKEGGREGGIPFRKAITQPDIVHVHVHST